MAIEKDLFTHPTDIDDKYFSITEECEYLHKVTKSIVLKLYKLVDAIYVYKCSKFILIAMVFNDSWFLIEYSNRNRNYDISFGDVYNPVSYPELNEIKIQDYNRMFNHIKDLLHTAKNIKLGVYLGKDIVDPKITNLNFGPKIMQNCGAKLCVISSWYLRDFSSNKEWYIFRKRCNMLKIIPPNYPWQAPYKLYDVWL